MWEDRVKFRRALKDGCARYADFIEKSGERFERFWRETLAPDRKRRLFQLPVAELHRVISDDFGFSESYRVVLLSVAKQVENFAETLYEDRTPSATERRFQGALGSKRGAFVVAEEYFEDGDGGDGFLARFREQASTKLIAKPPREEKAPDAAGDADGAGAKTAPRVAQSFKADRRLLRLVIFRQFADVVMSAFKRADEAAAAAAE